MNTNENFDKEELLDIKSPYIKNNLYGIDDVRERIAKRASGSQETEGVNILYVKNEFEKGGSDTLLRQKITNVSKKIVGEEIKKFAEVAGREISSEFTNLEKRLEKNMYDHFVVQNENLIGTEKELSRKIDSEIIKLNSLIAEMENRIKDLEIYSFSNLAESEEKKEINHQSNEYAFVLDKKENDSKTILEEMREVLNSPTSLETSIKIIEEKKESAISDVEKYYSDTQDRNSEEKYINQKMKELCKSFEKSGTLFKKNNFTSKLKYLNTEEFLNDNEELKNIDKNDKEKLTNIIINLMDSLNIDPKEDEMIEIFFQRAYQKEYREKK